MPVPNRTALLTAVLGVAALACLWTAPPAGAAPRLSASRTADLPRSGTTVTVTGAGYDLGEPGVYVAWCRVVPGYWKSADNCADARWIHGSGRTGFSTPLRITPTIAGADCTAAGRCSILTMNAHGSSDRGQDRFVSVSFAKKATAPTRTAAPTRTTPRTTTGNAPRTVPATPTTARTIAPATGVPSAPRGGVSTTPPAPATASPTTTVPPRTAAAPTSSTPVPAGSPASPAVSAVADTVADGSGSGSPAPWIALAVGLCGALGAGGFLALRRRAT